MSVMDDRNDPSVNHQSKAAIVCNVCKGKDIFFVLLFVEVCLPLSERDIEQISGNISTKWDRLARLLNMEEGFVDDIRTNTSYPDARSKAVKVVQQYRNDAEFDLRELIHWLQVLEIRMPDDWVKYIPSKSDETMSSLQGTLISDLLS